MTSLSRLLTCPLTVALLCSSLNAWMPQRISSPRRLSVSLAAIGNQRLSSLPPGLSPFEKSVAKSIDIQGRFRQLASTAVDKALGDGQTLLEIDFPPFVGGDQSKTQFDDYDNLQELDANRDWCVQVLPLLKTSRPKWLVLPDDKEVELAVGEWKGQRYRAAASFTSIRAATSATAGEASLKKAWGSTLASTVNKLTGGDGILADSSTLDALDASVANRVHLVCQPGNGGPVEDWINVEKLHEASFGATTIVVNGALDKVRDGYYPAIFFPALAATVPFYQRFQAAFILKPLSDKGLYGWLYRVYPEPWQVVLQAPIRQQKGSQTVMQVVEKVAMVSDKRPTYAEAVQALLKEQLAL